MLQLAAKSGLSEAQIAAMQQGDMGPLLETADPETRALMTQMMQARQQSGPKAPAVVPNQHRLETMDAHLKLTTTMLQYLADAMGACPMCWGRSPTCKMCGGNGAPGTRVPNQSEFIDLVEPVLARLGLVAVPAQRLFDRRQTNNE